MKFKRQLRMLFVAVTFSTASLGWLMTGCKETKHVKAPSFVIFVLFDISGSTAIQEIRQRYFDDFQKILAEVCGDELLIGDVITKNTLATSSYPINESFPVYNPFVDNTLTHKQKIQKAIESVKEKAKKLILKSSPAPRSDLLNAFQTADKIFNGERYKSSPHKILVVFSDMIEQSHRYDFKAESLTQSRVQEIINTLKKQNQMPNLKGVKVWIAGATAGVKGGMSPQKIYEIENFWLRYFESCGADLTKERRSTTLLNFKLPKWEDIKKIRTDEITAQMSYPIASVYADLVEESVRLPMMREALYFTIYQLMRIIGLTLVGQYLTQETPESSSEHWKFLKGCQKDKITLGGEQKWIR